MANVQIDDLNNLPSAADAVVFPVDNGIQTYKSSFLQIKNFILGIIPTTLSDLVSKQDDQKLIQIVAVQRTFKTTPGNGSVIASDASAATANAWNTRHLNRFSQTPNSIGYFDFSGSGSGSARIFIYKPGSYKVQYEGMLRRGNFCQIQSEYFPPSGDTIFKQIRSRTATGATSVGNESYLNGSMILDIPSGREGGYITFQMWAQTKTSNENWGLWYCRGVADAPHNYTDTCQISVTLIEE